MLYSQCIHLKELDSNSHHSLSSTLWVIQTQFLSIPICFLSYLWSKSALLKSQKASLSMERSIKLYQLNSLKTIYQLALWEDYLNSTLQAVFGYPISALILALLLKLSQMHQLTWYLLGVCLWLILTSLRELETTLSWEAWAMWKTQNWWLSTCMEKVQKATQMYQYSKLSIQNELFTHQFHLITATHIFQ